MKKLFYILLFLLPTLCYGEEIAQDSTKRAKNEFNKACWMPVIGRIDRNADSKIDKKTPFVYKGEIAVGAYASYTTLTTSNTNLLTLFEGIDVSGTIASVTPYMGYFYRNNRYIGVKFGYSYIQGEVASATIDLGDSNGITFDVPYVGIENNSYNVSIFHRSYISLDKRNRIGLYAELELAMARGNSVFSYDNGDIIQTTRSKSESIDLKFNPGVAVFILPNICTTLSFGLGGLSYSNIKQYNASGAFIGERTSSDFNMKFNLLDISLGIVIHFWKKENKI